jgi:hypothetical protein
MVNGSFLVLCAGPPVYKKEQRFFLQKEAKTLIHSCG